MDVEARCQSLVYAVDADHEELLQVWRNHLLHAVLVAKHVLQLQTCFIPDEPLILRLEKQKLILEGNGHC